MVVFALVMLFIQHSQLGMHRDVQWQALCPSCCFQGILAFNLLLQERQQIQTSKLHLKSLTPISSNFAPLSSANYCATISHFNVLDHRFHPGSKAMEGTGSRSVLDCCICKTNQYQYCICAFKG